MSKIEIEFKNQLEENINIHKNILSMSEDVIDVIKIINKKLKKVAKYYSWKWRFCCRCSTFSSRIYCEITTSRK